MIQKIKSKQISMHCIMACIYFLLLPTTIAVVSVGNSILKVATVPIALYFLVTIVISGRKLQINGVHLALLVFTLTTIFTLFLNADELSVINVIGYVLNAALYICITVIPYNKAELKWMENVQIILLVILNALTLLSNGTRFDRTTLVIMGQTSDPNYFVGFFVFPLTIALKQLVTGKKRGFYLLLIAVSMYSIFLSGSRGGFLAIAVTIAGFAMLYPSNLAKRVVYFLGGFFFIAVLWIVLKPILPENIVERMSIKAVVETGGTGRTDIWKSMIQEIVDHPEYLLFGRGIVTMHSVFLSGAWERVVAHNQIIQIIYNQGLVGFLAFMFLTAISFFRCVKRRKTVAIAILGMMALSVSLSFNQTTRTFWNLIAYAAFAFPEEEIKTQEYGGISDNE